MKCFNNLILAVAAIVLLQSPAESQSSNPTAAPSPTPTIVEKTVGSDSGNPNADESQTEVQVNYTYENLTNNFGDWHTASLDFSHKFKPRQTFYGSYRETERIRQRDREFVAGFYQPLNRKWLLLVEAGASPTHRVLPKWSALAQIERSFKNGWNLQGGYRRVQYNAAKVNLGIFGAEKYWGNNRAAYTLYVNNLESGGTSVSHRFQLNHYYGEPLNSVGASFGFGRELESLGAGRGVLRTDVQSVSVYGNHFFTRNWGANYNVTFHRQGSLYIRRGGTIGVRFRF
jgi:YaiO family outer membrane protein